MKLKIVANAWRGGHEHVHRQSRMMKKRCLEWPLRLRDYVEAQQDARTVSEYPAALLTVFEATMKRCPSVSIDTDVMAGQPCIAETRIPVRSILRAIEHYGSIEGAVMCYPDLTAQQVQDALFFSQVILELPRGDESSVAS